MVVERAVRKKGKYHETCFQEEHIVYPRTTTVCTDPTQYAPLVAYCVCRVHKMLQRSILCMQGTQYATKRSILCRGAFCGPTMLPFECVVILSLTIFKPFWDFCRPLYCCLYM